MRYAGPDDGETFVGCCMVEGCDHTTSWSTTKAATASIAWHLFVRHPAQFHKVFDGGVPPFAIPAVYGTRR